MQIREHLLNNPDGDGQRFLGELLGGDADGNQDLDKDLNDKSEKGDGKSQGAKSTTYAKRKVVTIKHKTMAAIKGPEGKNFWPYSDSYVPKLKQIKDELIPEKERH